jgi:putative toxin-antitoxin system antitoxin component (TIGR02293 family)
MSNALKIRRPSKYVRDATRNLRRVKKYVFGKRVAARKATSSRAERFMVRVTGDKMVKIKTLGTDVQIHCVRNLTENTQSPSLTPSNLIRVVLAGLPVQELKDLQASLALPMERLGPMLGISKATLQRRQSEQRLGSAESDRVVRFAKLMGKAVKVMESEEIARKWLNSPQRGLGGVVPLEFAETEVGAREVEDLLGRIEYGVYS